MEKKEILVIVLKVVVYAVTLVLAALGVSAVTSCSTYHETNTSGRAVIVTNDTTIINHSGYTTFKPFSK